MFRPCGRHVAVTLRTRSTNRLPQSHTSPGGIWNDQGQHEWVIVLKGAARLRFEDGVIEMRPGDFVNITAFKKYRVDWTTPDKPTVWLGVHYGDVA
jgi:cupin 2 domain-containing protein